MTGNRLYIVIPCYNEEDVLPETSRRLIEKLNSLIGKGRIAEDSRIVFVNDGSKDRTWEIICALHEKDPHFSGICLSRNRGHQNALLAGLMTVRSKADFTISLDADLQDDIDAIDEMTERYLEGFDIVYAVRSSRKKDSFFKRATAEGFYRLMNSMGCEVVFNHADYRLMSRRALDGLAEFEEYNLFLRGIIPMIGYKSTTVEYERGERFAGESKYPLKKMLALAFEGITSLSVKPLWCITAAGAVLFFIAVVFLIVSFFRAVFGNSVSGWAIASVSAWGAAGLCMLCTGIVGQYAGKIYLETKKRPRFIIEQFLDK